MIPGEFVHARQGHNPRWLQSGEQAPGVLVVLDFQGVVAWSELLVPVPFWFQGPYKYLPLAYAASPVRKRQKPMFPNLINADPRCSHRGVCLLPARI